MHLHVTNLIEFDRICEFSEFYLFVNLFVERFFYFLFFIFYRICQLHHITSQCVHHTYSQSHRHHNLWHPSMAKQASVTTTIIARSRNGDVGARRPDLGSLLAVPAPAQHVISRLDVVRHHQRVFDGVRVVVGVKVRERVGEDVRVSADVCVARREVPVNCNSQAQRITTPRRTSGMHKTRRQQQCYHRWYRWCCDANVNINIVRVAWTTTENPVLVVETRPRRTVGSSRHTGKGRRRPLHRWGGRSRGI